MFLTSIFCGSLFCGSAVHILIKKVFPRKIRRESLRILSLRSFFTHFLQYHFWLDMEILLRWEICLWSWND